MNQRPTVKQISNTIVSQLTSFIWDDKFIQCTCPFCVTHKDELHLHCLQQILLELNCQLDVLYRH